VEGLEPEQQSARGIEEKPGLGSLNRLEEPAERERLKVPAHLSTSRDDFRDDKIVADWRFEKRRQIES
jgi:hypothetical protein